jgi:hypothetical protein
MKQRWVLGSLIFLLCAGLVTAQPYPATLQQALTSLGYVLSTSSYVKWAKSQLYPSGAYLNFGATSGAAGYGLRDDGTGVVQAKSFGGSWTSIIPITGTAPATATYLIKTANASLPNAQVLGSLSTGVLKVTTATGVLSIAVAGDFPTLNQSTTGTSGGLALASQTLFDLFYATGATTTGRIPNGTTGQVLTASTAGAPSWQSFTATAASALTGTTLAANVVNSTLSRVGTIAYGTWNAGAVTANSASITASGGLVIGGSVGFGQAALGHDDGTAVWVQTLDSNRNLKLVAHGSGILDLASPTYVAALHLTTTLSGVGPFVLTAADLYQVGTGGDSVLQTGTLTSMDSVAGSSHWLGNAYRYLAAGNYYYLTTGYAAGLVVTASTGETAIYTAPSGTAGTVATFTKQLGLSTAGVMTLTALASGTLSSVNGVITSSSDEALKDHIKPLGYGLREVLKLRPIRYHWTVASGLTPRDEFGGFGARQVEPIMPIAVSHDAHGVRSLSDRVILGATVNAIQELEARVERLERERGQR